MLSDILICPTSKNGIKIDADHGIARVEQSDHVYPIEDGVIDFLPNKADLISTAYDSIAPYYDDYVNLSRFYWKLFTLIIWGFLDDKLLLDTMLSSIPDDFDGVLLDVPVGTGLLTVNKYRKLNKAQIIALDYSSGMLTKAQRIYAEHGIENVTFIKGDASCLPLKNESIDLCLSMCGLHAFVNKTEALSEIARVLKGNKIFAGGFYIKGKRFMTDLFVRHGLSRKGYFSPPFYNEHESLSRLEEYFNIEHTITIRSFYGFNVTKK